MEYTVDFKSIAENTEHMIFKSQVRFSNIDGKMGLNSYSFFSTN